MLEGVVALAGKTQIRSFSVKKYGEEQARQMAIEARRQMLQSVPDRFWVATEASLNLTRQTFDHPDALATGDTVVRDEAANERFLARLRVEGLIDQPPCATGPETSLSVTEGGGLGSALYRRR